MNHPIPDTALDDRLGFVGTAGSGKTYCAGTGVERLLDKGARCIIIDPLDVWFGLRATESGAGQSGYNVVILGGQHGDLPLNEHAGALIGETVASSAESFIVSLAALGTKAAERRFMLAFLVALYRHTNGEPVHLIFDEADMWAPQRLLDKEGEAAKLLGQMETIVRRGRVKGFIPWLITQRPAVLSKDVLSQVDGLIAFKLTSSQDRDAIGAWIEGQADRQEGKEILASLPAMQRGRGVVWVPSRGILETATFPRKKTFDSSATPKRGETKRAATLKPLNVEALKGRLEIVAKEADANDPRKLRARIDQLQREKAKLIADHERDRGHPKMDREALTSARREGFYEGIRAVRPIADRLTTLAASFTDTVEGLQSDLRRLAGAAAVSRPNKNEAPYERLRDEYAGVAYSPAAKTPAQIDGLPPGVKSDSSADGLPSGERSVLTACAQHHEGCTREQISILTGYKRSTRDAYVQRLRDKGYLATALDASSLTPNGRFAATSKGFRALGPDFKQLPTGEALREYWIQRLPDGERAVLDILIRSYPNPVDREQIDTATNYKRSSRDAYIQRLKARQLVLASERGQVRASDILFS